LGWGFELSVWRYGNPDSGEVYERSLERNDVEEAGLIE